MSNTPGLKPCPFCGMKIMAYREHPKLGIAIECQRFECNVMTRYFKTRELAIEAWNRTVNDEKGVMQMKLSKLLSVVSPYEYVYVINNNVEIFFDEARNVEENKRICEKEVECFYSGTRNNTVCTIVILKGD